MNQHEFVERRSRPLLLRALYFIFIGWWLTFFWINFAWAANATVIGLPLGLWMLNRVPQVLTMKPMPRRAELTLKGDVISIEVGGVPQRFWLWRLIYFLLIGWWASLIWANAAWFLCVTIIGIPVGILMFNYLPVITTLMRTE